jgi:acyl-CoA synthetase (AMP-forming)/AMP-acid ligase II
LPGYEVKIADPETGKALSTGDIGELWVRSPFIMEGYYGKPRSQVFEADGWWRSGDFGTFDAAGCFYFRGRRGDMIKTAGANVAPPEVESVLRELTGAPQCFVVGLPDAERGHIVAAIIVAEHDIDEVGLTQRLAVKLSSYKVPRRILRIAQNQLPLLSNGKVDLRKLPALFQSR